MMHLHRNLSLCLLRLPAGSIRSTLRTMPISQIKDSDEEMVDATSPKANNKQSSIKSEKKGLKTPTTPQNVRRAQKMERPAIEQIDLNQFPRGLRELEECYESMTKIIDERTLEVWSGKDSETREIVSFKMAHMCRELIPDWFR